MNIIDTNGLDRMIKEAIKSKHAFFITPDIEQEFEWHEQPLPSGVFNAFNTDDFDKASYLRSYQEMLNKHGGRSFYNMTGFGDISILALLKVLEQNASSTLLPEEVVVVTDDQPLTRKIEREFMRPGDRFGETISIMETETFFKSR